MCPSCRTFAQRSFLCIYDLFPPRSGVSRKKSLDYYSTSKVEFVVTKKVQKHTTAGIRWWSPTQLLISRSSAYVWQSGRDAQLSEVCGRMWKARPLFKIYTGFCCSISPRSHVVVLVPRLSKLKRYYQNLLTIFCTLVVYDVHSVLRL